jgi:hypothetical protein
MEFTAMLVIQFDASVDAISREMFDKKFGDLQWRKDPSVSCVWTLQFERSSRESALQSTRTTLELALQGARIERSQARAIVHFGADEPGTV